MKREAKEKVQGVYVLINTTNQKKYIGSSMDIHSRLQTHFSALNKGTHNCLRMQHDFNNGDQFKTEVLWTPKKHTPEQLLRKVEAWFILRENTHIYGYNVNIAAFTNEKSGREKAIDPFTANELVCRERKKIARDKDKENQFATVLSIIDVALKSIDWDIEDLYYYDIEKYRP